MNQKKTTRWLLVASVMALLAGPVIMVMAAFSASGILMGGAIIIMGSLGLFAGMMGLNKEKDHSSSDRN